MKRSVNPDTNKISYLDTIRFLFVVFSLYLMGDTFYRWDGFKYYAYFSEFIPSVALITLLWSGISLLTAVVLWIFLKALEMLPVFMRKVLRPDFILIFVCFLILSIEMVYLGKRFLTDDILSSGMQNKIFLYVSCGVTLLAWLLRNKLNVIQERITPLVWLFATIVILSVPVVAYNTFFKVLDENVSQTIVRHSDEDKSRPNIIFVIFDAMTAQDMSVYGYHRDTTPFISEWAKEASVFTRLQAGSNWTPPTVASIMTGKRVWTHQVYQPFGNRIKKGDIESLPLMLRKNGFYTMSYVTNHYSTIKKLGIDNGFDIDYPVNAFMSRKTFLEDVDFELHRLFFRKIRLYNWFTQKDFIFSKFYNFLYGLMQIKHDNTINRIPELAFNKFLEDINSSNREPYFAWIHIYPPHEPYLPPEPYMGVFDSSSQLRTSVSQNNVKELQYRYRNKKMQDSLHEFKKDMNILRARYDEDIMYCDKQFEEFILKLREKGELKNTVIILSSDHGESFEHIKVGHGENYLYDQLTHVPLIIKEPGQTEGRIINNLIDQIDIAPTIMDLADIQVPSWVEGRSFKPLMRGETLFAGPVFSMNFQSNSSRGDEINRGVIAVWEGDYKLIHYIGNTRKSFIFDHNSLLFNLHDDPDELVNIYEKKPEIGKRLLNLIQNNLENANERLRK